MKVLVALAVVCFASARANYGGYAGPQASPVVNPNGFLADTPEVAAAKAAHFSEVAKASAPSGYAPGPYNGAPAYNPSYAPAPQYSAPAPAYPYTPGAPGVTPQGFLADTPEIAAAKAAHFAEKAKVASKGPEAYDDGSYRPEYDNPNYGAPAPAAPAYSGYSQAPAPTSYHGYNPQPYSAPAPSHYSAATPSHYSAAAPSYAAPAPSHHGSHYAGPLAQPVVTPQGFLAETPEVAAAKAAHFAEFAKAGSHAPAAPAHHHRYRRSAVAPLLVHSAPVVAPYSYPYYSYPYAYTHAPLSRFAYTVSTW